MIVQPTDGIKPILAVIENAAKSLDLMIFRFDLKEVEKAIEAASNRGVVVRALIAHTNAKGEKQLRQLEQRLLNAGIIVARTADDLVRYHGKAMIVDREELYVFGFNFTKIDLKSRSFGLVTRDRGRVQDALKLFEADSNRQEFEPAAEGLVVSPENAREQLATFIKRTKKQLAIYDEKLTDPQMLRLLNQRAKAGVDVRIIGKVSKRGAGLKAQKMVGMRQHIRAMIRDGDTAFVGSQSLRAQELDARREVGLIVKDAKVVKVLLESFESDWAKTDLGQKEIKIAVKEQAVAEEVAS